MTWTKLSAEVFSTRGTSMKAFMKENSLTSRIQTKLFASEFLTWDTSMKATFKVNLMVTQIQLQRMSQSKFTTEPNCSIVDIIPRDIGGMCWLEGVVSKENLPSREWLERNEMGPQWIKEGILHPNFLPHVYGIQSPFKTWPTRKRRYEEDFLFPRFHIWEKLHLWNLNFEINESLIEGGIVERKRLENNEPLRYQTGKYRCVPSPLRRSYTSRYLIEWNVWSCLSKISRFIILWIWWEKFYFLNELTNGSLSMRSGSFACLRPL